MPSLDETILIATEAHKGQVDKQGRPYILHPLRVMMAFEPWQTELCQIALLHDAVEDTQLTPLDLMEAGFNHIVVDAVIAMTHIDDEPYLDYIARVKENSYARQVKIADIKDNCSFDRLMRLEDHKTVERLSKKYAKALAVLESD